MTSRSKSLWKNEYFQTAVMIGLIIVIVFGFWYGSRMVLNTDYPMLAVASGSMCMLPGSYCDGWSHPFERTLHTGDLIVVQGVRPEEIYAAPYNESGSSGDIIVFRSSIRDELIVHRAIDKTEQNGAVVSFTTHGDGNTWGANETVPVNYFIGRVVLRIPWIGHLALIMRNSAGVYLIIGLIIILIVIELLIPVFRGKKPVDAPQPGNQEVQDNSNKGDIEQTSQA